MQSSFYKWNDNFSKNICFVCYFREDSYNGLNLTPHEFRNEEYVII